MTLVEMRERFLSSRIKVILCLVILHNACSHTPASPSPKDRLNARIWRYYSAFDTNDYKTMYEMIPPGIRQVMTFEEWKRDRGLDQPQEKRTRKIRKAELDEICRCGERRCVIIVRLKLADSEGRESIGRVGEMWEHIDGEWYYGYPSEYNSCR